MESDFNFEIISMNEIKSIEEISKRCYSLFLIATYSNGLIQKNCSIEESQNYIQKFINKFNAISYLSEKEIEYIKNKYPNDEEIGYLCWRWESLYFLLWTIGYIDELGLPIEPCMAFKCTKIFNKYKTLDQFIKNSKLKSKKEILENFNLLINNSKDFDKGVFMEWKRSLIFLFINKNWDEIVIF